MDVDVRRLKRRHLIYYLEVLDLGSNRLIGHVVDITTRGLKLVSREPVETEKTFQLQMVLPEGYFEEKLLVFKATSLWSAKDVNPDFYVTGFELAEGVKEETRRILESLIDQVGFND